MAAHNTGDSAMAECLNNDPIDLAINAEMEQAGKAFAALGCYMNRKHARGLYSISHGKQHHIEMAV